MQRGRQSWPSASTIAVTCLVCIVFVCRSCQTLTDTVRQDDETALDVNDIGANYENFNANAANDAEIVTAQQNWLLSDNSEVSDTPQVQTDQSLISDHGVDGNNSNGGSTLSEISSDDWEQADWFSLRPKQVVPQSRNNLEVKFLSPTQGQLILGNYSTLICIFVCWLF